MDQGRRVSVSAVNAYLIMLSCGHWQIEHDPAMTGLSSTHQGMTIECERDPAGCGHRKVEHVRQANIPPPRKP